MKNSFTILLAFWFLFISCGWSVNKHYCKDKFKSLALFVMPQTCHTEGGIVVENDDVFDNFFLKVNKLKKCCRSADVKNCCSIKDKRSLSCEKQKEGGNCCHNESEFVKLNENLISPVFQNFLPDKLFVYFNIETLNYTLFNKNICSELAFYIPPDFIKNRPVLFQSFLY